MTVHARAAGRSAQLMRVIMLHAGRATSTLGRFKRRALRIIRPLAPSRHGFRGGIDGVSRGCVSGWLVPPEPVYVRAGDLTVASFAPDAARADVVAAGKCENPRVGIAFRIDGEILADHAALGFFVKRANGWVELPGSPVDLSECRRNARTLAGLLASPPLIVTDIRQSGGDVVITGLLIPQARTCKRDLELRINGERCDNIAWSAPTQDQKNYFWYLGPLGNCEFTVTVTALAAAGQLRMEAVDAVSGECANPYQFHELSNAASRRCLPDAGAQIRVLGWTNDLLFRATGRDHMLAIAALVRKYRGDFDWATRSVLDWGCGCGRIAARFLEDPELRPARLVGVDIDPVNIAWCRDNLAGAEFHLTGIRPPLPFADGSFDCIHGNSVFTHLDAEHQDRWLAELGRLLKADGVAVVTVNSSSALAFGSADSSFIEAWHRRGIYFPGRNSNLDEVIDHPDYYRDTFHTHDYVRGHWSRFFEVVAIHEMVFGYQDAVVLRKRQQASPVSLGQ